MPTYEYRCKSCGHGLEVVQSFTDEPLTKCPSCKKKQLKKVFGSIGITFKGSGFYKTDNRSSGKRGSGSSSSSESSSEKSTAGSSSGSADGAGSSGSSNSNSAGSNSSSSSSTANTST